MLYNVRQSYTPALEAHEFNPHALIIDTETVGTGSSIEVVEVALCDFEGRVLLDSLVRPVYNPPPRSTPAQRFDSAEFDAAPDWTDVWPALAALADNKLLVAYNAAFDRRALAATCARNRLPADRRARLALRHAARQARPRREEEPPALRGVRALRPRSGQPPRRRGRARHAPPAQAPRRARKKD